MHDAEIMQIPYSLNKLDADLLNAIFREDKVSLLYVVEQIFASQILNHYVVVIWVFEDVYQLDDILVLAHFQDLDLLALLSDLNRFHVGFLDQLNSKLVPCLLVVCKLH